MTALDRTIVVYWVDAFTQVPFTGNPAVVVSQADGLTETQMQQIAWEMNCSETAFITQASHPEADLRLRWFTPKAEVDLCGHATIAAMHVLAMEGRFKLGVGTTQILYLETRSGLLSVTVDYTAPQGAWTWLTLPSCEFQPLSTVMTEKLLPLLGLTNLEVQQRPVQESLNGDVLVAVKNLQQLYSLQPDLSGLASLGTQQSWRGICVFTTETLEPQSAAHSRFFAPQFGILEDPATGSVSGPLALYLQQSNQLKQSEVASDPRGLTYVKHIRGNSPGASEPVDNLNLCIVLEQGDCLDRPGRVWIDLTGPTPKLGGQATTVMRGELLIQGE
jgi:PhzF family phenazine biosynthesis protein